MDLEHCSSVCLRNCNSVSVAVQCLDLFLCEEFKMFLNTFFPPLTPGEALVAVVFFSLPEEGGGTVSSVVTTE